MSSISRFNVRVYGLIIHREHLLICREPFEGSQVSKLPGGGLEFGEGPEEAMLRELDEELDQSGRILRHFYTTGFFVRSRVNPSDQLLSIYYECELEQPEAVPPGGLDRNGIEFRWLPLRELNPSSLDLPVDQHVIKMLVESLHRS